MTALAKVYPSRSIRRAIQVGVLLLLPCASPGQDLTALADTGTACINTLTSTVVPCDEPDPDRDRFVLAYSTLERCYECNTRTLMHCFDGSDDCNVPWKTVEHVKLFDTIKEALEFLSKDKDRKLDKLYSARVLTVDALSTARFNEKTITETIIETCFIASGEKVCLQEVE